MMFYINKISSVQLLSAVQRIRPKPQFEGNLIVRYISQLLLLIFAFLFS